LEEYDAQFMEGSEGSTRAAAKRLTQQIRRELVEATINAPDWYACSPLTSA
jgi:glycerol-3-phosphate O-acyltransferase/dihydroxyacetone phosphate acyltransferase